MQDHYIRAISVSGGIRMLVCSTSKLAGHICSMQGTSPTATVALGRGLAAGALMGGLLKGGQSVALKFEGNGPLGKMIIEAEGDGAVRGYVANPLAEAEPVEGRWNVPGVLGRAGFLTVAKDDGRGKEPYRGMVQLKSSEIGDDLAAYLAESEQTPSAVGVAVSLAIGGTIAVCGGFLVQALPRADDSEIDAVMAHIRRIEQLSTLLAESGTDGVLATLMGDIPYNSLETRELFFRCGCSRSKVEQALYSLGSAGLKEIRENEGFAEVTCEFCRQKYRFDKEELKRIEMLVALPEKPEE
jgi:molecular chaperone Hsp33